MQRKKQITGSSKGCFLVLFFSLTFKCCIFTVSGVRVSSAHITGDAGAFLSQYIVLPIVLLHIAIYRIVVRIVSPDARQSSHLQSLKAQVQHLQHFLKSCCHVTTLAESLL